MKPAFLMLSSCHVVLWRQTRSTNGSETDISAAHLDKSCRWLQLVYGQGNPEVTSEERLEVFDTLSSIDATSSQANLLFAEEPIASDKRQRIDLERDLQVLRGRQAVQLQELAHTREVKRRLEDEATEERATRRRLERTLHDLETKLAKARRRGNDLQAHVRMEVNARRRSEQMVTEERAKRRALEDHLKRQAQSAKPLLEEFAGLFHRAGPVSDLWKTN
jgi:chromosome segregation ATPase